MTETLRFTIHPSSEEISFSGLESAISNVRQLVRSVDAAVTRERQASRKWYVEMIRAESPAVITVRPSLTLDAARREEATPDVIVRGIHTLTTDLEAGGPPPYFGDEQLEMLRRLGSVFMHDVKEIQFETDGESAQVCGTIREHVDRVRSRGYVELGSIEGELGAVDVHGRLRTFTIWDDLHGQPIRCKFGAEHMAQVKELLKERVLVAGRINYFATGQARAIDSISELVPIRTTGSPPVNRFGGSIPDLLNGMPIEEYIDRLRGQR